MSLEESEELEERTLMSQSVNANVRKPDDWRGLNAVERFLRGLGMRPVIRAAVLIPWSVLVMFVISAVVWVILAIVASVTGMIETSDALATIILAGIPTVLPTMAGLAADPSLAYEMFAGGSTPFEQAWNQAVNGNFNPMFSTWQGWVVLLLEVLLLWVVIMTPFAIQRSAQEHQSFGLSLLELLSSPGKLWNRMVGRLFLPYLETQNTILALLLPIILIAALSLLYSGMSGIYLIWANQYGRAFGFNPMLLIVVSLIIVLGVAVATSVFVVSWCIMAAPLIIPYALYMRGGKLYLSTAASDASVHVGTVTQGSSTVTVIESSPWFMAVMFGMTILIAMMLLQWIPNLITYYASDNAYHQSMDMFMYFPFAPSEVTGRGVDDDDILSKRRLYLQTHGGRQ